MEKVLDINSVADYFKWRDSELLHPLVSILDYSKLNRAQYSYKGYNAIRWGCYGIFLKDSKHCKIKYGGKDYDYDEGTLVFVGPNQTVGLTQDENYVPKGYALLFHPDLLIGTGLTNKMSGYTYFSYSVNEALHLSTKERKIILSLLDKIQFELEQNMDRHSKKLIVANIELLLDYCLRFYDRQFFTREVTHQSSMNKFENLLGDYFSSDKPQKYGLPSVGYFADKLHLSSNYFGDLVKKETGKSAQEYIQAKLIDVAKAKVFDPNKSVSEIAYELGFRYPQHFSRLFKQQVGHSPNEFRMLN